MKVGRLVESFCILPNLAINWRWFMGDLHFDIQFAWLFWYISTYKADDELINKGIKRI